MRSVNSSIHGWVANTLPAIAAASPAAGALLHRAFAGSSAESILITLAVWTHVPGVADAHSALKSAFPLVAFRAVPLSLGLAAAAALREDFHFQHVTETHWFYHNIPGGFITSGQTYGHIEGDLEEKMVSAYIECRVF